MGNSSPARRGRYLPSPTGVKRIVGEFPRLYRFSQEQPKQMHTFAHHENVAEKVAAALEISTYYGKTASERKRNRIIQDFRDGDMLPAFMVANDMEIELDLPAALYVVYLEMPRSFSKCENVLNRVSGDNTEKLVSMYFLASENFLDKRSQYRLQIREKEYDALMDGVTTK